MDAPRIFINNCPLWSYQRFLLLGSYRIGGYFIHRIFDCKTKEINHSVRTFINFHDGAINSYTSALLHWYFGSIIICLLVPSANIKTWSAHLDRKVCKYSILIISFLLQKIFLAHQITRKIFYTCKISINQRYMSLKDPLETKINWNRRNCQLKVVKQNNRIV